MREQPKTIDTETEYNTFKADFYSVLSPLTKFHTKLETLFFKFPSIKNQGNNAFKFFLNTINWLSRDRGADKNIPLCIWYFHCIGLGRLVTSNWNFFFVFDSWICLFIVLKEFLFLPPVTGTQRDWKYVPAKEMLTPIAVKIPLLPGHNCFAGKVSCTMNRFLKKLSCGSYICNFK